MEETMRISLISLIVVLMSGRMQAETAARDYFELGVGAQTMFDWQTFNTPNEVDMDRDVFKLTGDYALGYALNATVGHRYDTRDFIIKYNYYGTMGYKDDDMTNWTIEYSGMSANDYRVGSFRSHTYLVGMRYPLPDVGRFSSFVDLTAGAVTAVYVESYYNSDDEWYVDDREVSTGFVANLSYGLSMELNSSLDFYFRYDLFLGKIPDRYNARNYKVANGPDMHSSSLNLGLRKFFVAPF